MGKYLVFQDGFAGIKSLEICCIQFESEKIFKLKQDEITTTYRSIYNKKEFYKVIDKEKALILRKKIRQLKRYYEEIRKKYNKNISELFEKLEA